MVHLALLARKEPKRGKRERGKKKRKRISKLKTCEIRIKRLPLAVGTRGKVVLLQPFLSANSISTLSLYFV